MPDARCTRGLVRKIVQKSAHEHTGSAEAIRHSLRNGLTAYTSSPRRSGLFDTVACEYGFVRPVGLAKPPQT
jgi:hypothetical protein